MELGITRIPHEASYWDVVRAIAEVLHSDEFRPFGARKENFDLHLTESNVSDARNGGMGHLTLPTESLAHKFLRYVQDEPIYILDPATNRKRKTKIFRGDRSKGFRKGLIETLAKTPFTEPDTEERHQKKLAELAEQFRIDSVEFGVFYRDQYPVDDKQKLAPRSFSIEFKKDLVNDDVGWLKFEYDHKLIRITVGFTCLYSWCIANASCFTFRYAIPLLEKQVTVLLSTSPRSRRSPLVTMGSHVSSRPQSLILTSFKP
jgi:RNA-dependent RNA polymerase